MAEKLALWGFEGGEMPNVLILCVNPAGNYSPVDLGHVSQAVFGQQASRSIILYHLGFLAR